MLDVVLQGAWVLYYLAMSLPFLAFGRIVVNAIFQEYSKEGKLFPSHIGIRNIQSDICYDDTKHY